MIGLIIAIIIFNIIAFSTNKSFSKKEIAHIWSFTIAFQMSFDVFIDMKYHAYWYFNQGGEWVDLPTHTILLPPINMIFLNWFPFKRPFLKKLGYLICWEIFALGYEEVSMLPKPWGYFNYGWWNLGYSAVIDPIIFMILVGYYKTFIKLHK